MKMKTLFGFVFFTFLGASLMFVFPTTHDGIATAAQIGEFFGVIGMGFGLSSIVILIGVMKYIKKTSNVDLMELELK